MVEQKIELQKMKEYLSEWFAGDLISKTSLGRYDSYERIYQIFEEGNEKDIIFEHVFGVSQLESPNAIVSTAGIKDEQLRGVVEQSIMLDAQIEAYRRENEEESSANQKQN